MRTCLPCHLRAVFYKNKLRQEHRAGRRGDDCPWLAGTVKPVLEWTKTHSTQIGHRAPPPRLRTEVDVVLCADLDYLPPGFGFHRS